MLWKLLIIFVTLGSFSNANAIDNVSCSAITPGISLSGDVCTKIPSTALTPLLTLLSTSGVVLRDQYIKEVNKSMTAAGVLNNLNANMIGSGVVNRFQLGVGATVSATQKSDITVINQSQQFTGLPNAGAAISPNLMFAFNLGWLLARGPSDDESTRSVAHKFNIFINAFSYNFSSPEVQNYLSAATDKVKLGGSASSGGIMVRYHFVDPVYDGIGIFEFGGISLGTGVFYQKQVLDVTYADTKAQTVTLGSGITGSWIADTKFSYNSTISSIPIELRTGFRMFYFLNIFAGGGSSFNGGSSSIAFDRTGPLSIAAQISAGGLTLPKIETTGDFGLKLNTTASAPTSINYVVGGFEFNVLMMKVLVEAMASKDTTALQVGVKAAF